MAWSEADIPDQTGRRAIVTGATNGIGYEAARALAARGAEVVLAVRDTARGDACAARIRATSPGARVSVRRLDLADLGSVAAFAEAVVGEGAAVDLLLNNAGLGLQPTRSVTVDGFERMFGTNHLGHFALAARLMPVLGRANAARVVTISSIAHRRGRIDFGDLQSANGYSGQRTYAQSKLANLMFALALARRLRMAGSRVASLAAHPGISRTNFFRSMEWSRLRLGVAGAVLGVVAQSAEAGALPGLYAATMPDAANGSYWGPDGLLEMRGAPRRADIRPQALDESAQDRLWAESERLTGVSYGWV